jgi:hypothetical protein
MIFFLWYINPLANSGMQSINSSKDQQYAAQVDEENITIDEQRSFEPNELKRSKENLSKTILKVQFFFLMNYRISKLC